MKNIELNFFGCLANAFNFLHRNESNLHFDISTSNILIHDGNAIFVDVYSHSDDNFDTRT